MTYQLAFGREISDLDVVIVDDSKSMQAIYRNIFSGIRNSRTRVYGNVDTALAGVMGEPPNLILTEWTMKPRSGYQLISELRHSRMDPLCFVPVLVISADGTRRNVESAFRIGAHGFLLKPVSPQSIITRMRWLCEDDRRFHLQNDRYVIDGIHERLNALQFTRGGSLARQLPTPEIRPKSQPEKPNAEAGVLNQAPGHKVPQEQSRFARPKAV